VNQDTQAMDFGSQRSEGSAGSSSSGSASGIRISSPRATPL
jgi:hypothetical protein